MASTPLRLFIDLDGKTLVQSQTNATAFNLPALVQGDTVPLEIMLLKRSSTYPSAFGSNAPFTVVAVSGLTLKVAVGTPTAATGSTAPGIFQNTFSADTVNNLLTGELYITPATVASLLGTATSGTATLEIEVSEGGTYNTVFQSSVTIKAELIEGAATPPAPTDSYMTALESTATFAKKIGEPGDTILLKSPNGVYGVLIYVDDAGALHTDSVTL